MISDELHLLMSIRDELKKNIRDFKMDRDDYCRAFDDYLDEMDVVKILGNYYPPGKVLFLVDPEEYEIQIFKFMEKFRREDDRKYIALKDEMNDVEDEICLKIKESADAKLQ